MDKMDKMDKIYATANPIEYYDVIINVDSMMNLPKGWEMKSNENGQKRYDEKKKLRSCVLGIVGNGNKGKSFILQKIVGAEFPSGFSVRTEGLSVKYPTIQEKNIILLDSAGLETPLVDNEDFQLKEETDPTDEAKDNEQIQLIARDKQLTELFLQKFVISFSDILLAVVGQLTYSDQKLLNRIKKDTLNQKAKQKHLFIVHNLMNFDEIQQVKDYIEETLCHSLTFKLRENKIVDLKSTGGTSSKNQMYFTEIVKDKAGTINSIVHLIMGREGTPAGDYYNETALDFLRRSAANYTNIEMFPILDRIKDHLVYLSKDLIENPIMKEDVEVLEKVIKLKELRNSEGELSSDSEIKLQLKKCFVDELGFSSFLNNGFCPNYRYYTKKEFLVIQIEISGEIKNFIAKVNALSDYYLFKFTGEKLVEDNSEKKEIASKSYFSSIDSGKFVLDIRILLSEINLTTKKLKKFEKKNGMITLFYEIETLQDDGGETINFDN